MKRTRRKDLNRRIGKYKVLELRRRLVQTEAQKETQRIRIKSERIKERQKPKHILKSLISFPGD
jgi:hypothetical protein